MMKNRELKNDRQKMYTIMFTEEERKLLEAKAQAYNYRYLSDYIRDCAIYESVIQINIEYTESVNNLFQQYIDEIKKFTKEVRRILKWDTTTSTEEKEIIQQALYRVYSQTKSLKKSVNDNINVEVIEKESKKKLYNKKLQELNETAKEVLNEVKK